MTNGQTRIIARLKALIGKEYHNDSLKAELGKIFHTHSYAVRNGLYVNITYDYFGYTYTITLLPQGGHRVLVINVI